MPHASQTFGCLPYVLAPGDVLPPALLPRELQIQARARDDLEVRVARMGGLTTPAVGVVFPAHAHATSQTSRNPPLLSALLPLFFGTPEEVGLLDGVDLHRRPALGRDPQHPPRLRRPHGRLDRHPARPLPDVHPDVVRQSGTTRAGGDTNKKRVWRRRISGGPPSKRPQIANRTAETFAFRHSLSSS